VAGERSRARAPQSQVSIEPKPLTRHTSGATKPAPRKPAPQRTAATAPVGTKRAAGRRRWLAPVVALVAVLALLGTVAGVSLVDPAAQARTDRAAASQARTSIEQMLSYNYKTIDAQAAQIEGLLTGSFKGDFSAAMAKDIKPLAVKNQTVVQAKVSDIGVMSSSDTTVKVLAFVNQARVGSDQKQPVVDQNRVIATMSKVGDRWLISKVEAF
jgi:Mce-associated membrane protein